MASKDIEDEKLLVDDDSVLKHERTSPDTSLNVTEQTTLLELSQTMNDVNEDDFQQVEMKPISDKNTMKSDDVENGKPEAPLIHVVSRDSTDKEDAPLIDEESKEHKTNGIPYNKDNEQNIKEIETNNLDQEDGKKDKKAIENGTNNEHSSKKSAKKRPSEKLKLVKTHSDHSQSSLQSPGDGGTPRGKPKGKLRNFIF